VDRKSTFEKRFGDLVALLRADPGNDAAQDLALSAATAEVADEPLEIEAGIAWSVIPDDLTLKGRLLARQVESVRIAAGAEPQELLALARALSHDLTPVASTTNIQVELLEVLVPPPGSGPGTGASRTPSDAALRPRAEGDRRTWRDRRGPGRAQYLGIERRNGGDRRITGERRLHLIHDQRAEIAALQAHLGRSARSLAWDAVLAAALALIRLAPRVPSAERRTYGIQLRRAIPRRAVEEVVELAERDADLRPRAAEVLQWIGLDAAELMLERLTQGEAIGIRTFYYDTLGGMQGIYPLVIPLLKSSYVHEVRHGVALLGRSGDPDGIAELVPLLTHTDESVRVAAVRAIAQVHEGPAAEPLRQALHHPDPRTRAAAAEGIAGWRGGALALLLVAALETERDRDVWQSLVTALGRLGTVESSGALAAVALARRSLLRRQGYTTGQRLAAVSALGLSDAPAARTTLERLARDAEGVIRYAADRVLLADDQRVG
jgi:HEAT repeat protein